MNTINLDCLTMKTRIRPLTVIFSILLLTGFGTIPYIFFFEMQLAEINIGTIIAAVMAVLLLLGLFSIFWLTLVVHIDQELQKITFSYPLRFQKKTFAFKEIKGFRYKYLPAIVDYKAIQFKTEDRQKFTVSDFETANLRELETLALGTFELRSTDHFSPLYGTEEQREIQSSRNFDVSQDREIRFLLIIGILTVVSSIGIVISKNNGALSFGNMVFYLVAALILLSMIKKLLKTSDTIKNRIKRT